MDHWTEDEFRRAATGTRLSPRSIEACRDVLVEGMTGIAAAARHQMLPAQLSRALGTLRERQADFERLATGRAKSGEMEVFTASEVGRAIYGPGFQSSLPDPHTTYEGPVVGCTPVYLIQKVGRTGILHPLSRLGEVPAVHSNVRISYGDRLEPARVETTQQAARGAELGR
jgi:hypothetical protein